MRTKKALLNALLGAALLGREHAQRLVFRTGGVVERLGIGKRHLLVIGTVRDQERAAHFLHHAIESVRFELFQRFFQRIHAQYPHDVVAGHRQRGFKA